MSNVSVTQDYKKNYFLEGCRAWMAGVGTCPYEWAVQSVANERWQDGWDYCFVNGDLLDALAETVETE